MNPPSHPTTAATTPTRKKNEWPIFISYRRNDASRKIALDLMNALEASTIEATAGQVFTLDAVTARHYDFQAGLVPHRRHSRALIWGAHDRAPKQQPDQKGRGISAFVKLTRQ